MDLSRGERNLWDWLLTQSLAAMICIPSPSAAGGSDEIPLLVPWSPLILHSMTVKNVTCFQTKWGLGLHVDSWETSRGSLETPQDISRLFKIP